jgi:hypothetical protein
MSERKPRTKAPEIEADPEAFERFRSAIHALAKAGPQHRSTKKPEAVRSRRKKSV